MAPIPDEEPSYSLESSFYGPGALWCWYLTVITARVITPILSRKKSPSSSEKDSSSSSFISTLEHLASILYPCLSAGHLARQIALFEPNDLPKLAESFAVLNTGGAKELENANPDFGPTVVKAVTGLNAPLRVCAVFLMTWALGAIVSLLAATATEYQQLAEPSQGVPSKTRTLLWRRISSQIPYVGVVGCLIFLIFRCRHAGIGAPMVAIFGLYLLHSLIGVAVYGSVTVIMRGGGGTGSTWLVAPPDAWSSAHEFYEGMEERWAPGLRSHEKALILLWFGLSSVIYGVLILGFGIAVGYIVWVFRFNYFPDVGVSISSLDQIFALLTGVFTVVYACKGSLYAWLLGLLLMDPRRHRRERNEGPVQAEQEGLLES